MDSTRIIIAIISYLFGFFSGWVVRSLTLKVAPVNSSKNAVLIAVTTIWVLSMVVELINPTYKTNPMVHGLMGSIVGFFYKFQPNK